MADSADQPTGGLLDSLRRFGDAVLGLAQRRLELFALELHEEKTRTLDLLVRAAAVAVLALLALMTATATIVVALWQTSPALVLAVLTVAYVAGTVGLARSLRRRMHQGPRPFAGTVEEFRKDRSCFGKQN